MIEIEIVSSLVTLKNRAYDASLSCSRAFCSCFARIKGPHSSWRRAECCPLHRNGTDKAESRGVNYPWTPLAESKRGRVPPFGQLFRIKAQGHSRNLFPLCRLNTPTISQLLFFSSFRYSACLVQPTVHCAIFFSLSSSFFFCFVQRT